jgi:dUTP pyrophosphatase
MLEPTAKPHNQADQPDPIHRQPERTTVMIRTGPAGRTPVYATVGSAGCDLYAATAITLKPGETRLLALDIVIALEPGVEAQIRPRSGLSLKTDLRVPNAPGTIDSDYRSEVGIILQNTFSQADLPMQFAANPDLAERFSRTARTTTLAAYLPDSAVNHLSKQFPELLDQVIYLDERGNPWGTLYLEPGERIAQMVLSRHLQADFVEHPDPASVGMDRGGGFGSTGTT